MKMIQSKRNYETVTLMNVIWCIMMKIISNTKDVFAMKKCLSILIGLVLALCLFCAAAATLAETVPTLNDMPFPVIEGDNTTIDEAAFQGAWKADKAFVGETFVTLDALKADYNITLPDIRLQDGSVFFDVADENGGTVEHGQAYTFEAGQIGFDDESGNNAVIDLLEDGNIMMSIFLKEEGDQVLCVTVFLVRADA